MWSCSGQLLTRPVGSTSDFVSPSNLDFPQGLSSSTPCAYLNRPLSSLALGLAAGPTPSSVPSSWPRTHPPPPPGLSSAWLIGLLTKEQGPLSGLLNLPLPFRLPLFLMTKVLSILSSSCLPRGCRLFLFGVFCDFLSAHGHPVFGPVCPELPPDPTLFVPRPVWSPSGFASRAGIQGLPGHLLLLGPVCLSLFMAVSVSSLCSSCCLPAPSHMTFLLSSAEQGPAHFPPLAGSCYLGCRVPCDRFSTQCPVSAYALPLE